MGKRVALVVGVSNYKYYSEIEYCVPSATDVYSVLISREFGNCDSTHSVLAVSQGGDEHLTVSGLDTLVVQSIRSLEPGDQFLFYFCGHARVHKNDLLLLLPKSEKEDPLSSYDFSAGLVKKLVSRDVDKSILIVDACHSAVMFNSISNFMSDWKPHRLPKGMGFMAAAGEYQYARQSPELKRTLFSYYFCEGITTWRDRSTPYITLSQMREYINGQIRANHGEEYQQAQTWIKESDGDLWISLNPAHTSAPTADSGSGDILFASIAEGSPLPLLHDLGGKLEELDQAFSLISHSVDSARGRWVDDNSFIGIGRDWRYCRQGPYKRFLFLAQRALVALPFLQPYIPKLRHLAQELDQQLNSGVHGDPLASAIWAFSDCVADLKLEIRYQIEQLYR